MYNSPIHLHIERITREILEKQDAYIVKEVQRMGIEVDKEELLRALKYDRDQYQLGYEDGKRDAVVHGRWVKTAYSYEDEHCRYNYWECSACGNQIAGRYGLHPYCPNCGAKMNLEVE